MLAIVANRMGYTCENNPYTEVLVLSGSVDHMKRMAFVAAHKHWFATSGNTIVRLTKAKVYDDI